VGVDLHRRTSNVVVLDGSGQVLLKRCIRSSPEDFLRVFGELEP
jgi:hypothetical protein